MIENIKDISIKGRCFTSDTKLTFFPNKSHRISLVYGKNGSGKSTVSDAFSHISSGIFPDDLSADLLDEEGRIIDPSENSKIFVFNESYIDNNVKIDDDGLGTIILLGGQVDLQSEIDKCMTIEINERNELSKLRLDYEKYTDLTDPLCPEYHFNKIKKMLQQGGWATRDAKIKDNKINTKVNEKIIDEICTLTVKESVSDLQKDFDNTTTLLEKVSDSTKSFPNPIAIIPYVKGFEVELCELLSKRIEKPILTEREQLIMQTIECGNMDIVEDTFKTFKDKKTKICPYCYQPLTDEYKKELLQNIVRVLSKEAENHKIELQKITFPIIDDYVEFASLDSTLVEKILVQKMTCDSIIEKYKQELNIKEKNVFVPNNITPLGLENALEDLNKLLLLLEEKRVEFSDASAKREKLKDSLILINKKIAHIQIKQLYKGYEKQILERNSVFEKLQLSQTKYDNTIKQLKSLQNRKANVALAINNINNALDYVFFSKERLSIELRQDKYYLKSKGRDVKPKNISLGERNIIALCYFFTQILSNQDINSLYTEEELVIIDDPVSSFDFENKVGIISFIRYQINKIIKGNPNSKVLIFSHDLSTIFELRKAMDEICQSTKGIANQKQTSYVALELNESQLDIFENQRNEYSMLLKKIYHYANEDSVEDDLVIGNVMRRVLEAFSTFTFRKGIEQVSCDSNILLALKEHSLYFENLMYRLVLHGESHYQEQIYSLHDNTSFIEYISHKEKKRTARDILCFIYCLNPIHIQVHLQTESNALANIKQWVNHIPKNSSFEMASEQSINNRKIKLFSLPLSAGIGNIIFDENQEFSEYETDNEECDFALKISGDSMDPLIPNGSIVLIKSCSTLSDGKVGAFFHNGEVFCKKLVYKGKNAYLVSENPNYADIEVLKDDNLKLYGEVIKII